MHQAKIRWQFNRNSITYAHTYTLTHSQTYNAYTRIHTSYDIVHISTSDNGCVQYHCRAYHHHHDPYIHSIHILDWKTRCRHKSKKQTLHYVDGSELGEWIKANETQRNKRTPTTSTDRPAEQAIKKAYNNNIKRNETKRNEIKEEYERVCPKN